MINKNIMPVATITALVAALEWVRAYHSNTVASSTVVILSKCASWLCDGV